MNKSQLVKKILLRDLSTQLSSIVLLTWLILSLLPQFSDDWREIEINLPKTRLPPNFVLTEPLGWFGYDSVGASVFLQILNGAHTSILVGLTTVALCLLVGIPLAAFAALNRGWIDLVISRAMDILLSFPPLVLPITLTFFMGGGLFNTVLALSLGGWIGSAKVIRGEFRSLNRREFVEAARAMGAGQWRIIVRHLLPHAAAPILIQSTFALAGVILAEAGLSFLGLGLGEGYVSWGTLLSEARSYLLESPHLAIFPSLALLSVVLSLNFLAESLRLALDPKAKSL
jgi:peptide/nickel transport system permease protein